MKQNAITAATWERAEKHPHRQEWTVTIYRTATGQPIARGGGHTKKNAQAMARSNLARTERTAT